MPAWKRRSINRRYYTYASVFLSFDIKSVSKAEQPIVSAGSPPEADGAQGRPAVAPICVNNKLQFTLLFHAPYFFLTRCCLPIGDRSVLLV